MAARVAVHRDGRRGRKAERGGHHCRETMPVTHDLQQGAMSDEESLAERIRSGDRAAENELIRLFSGRTLAMAVVRLRDREAARELVDDVMMAVVTALRRGTVNGTDRLGAFVYGTTINLINNRLRTLSRQPRLEAFDEEPAVPDDGESCDRYSELQLLQRCLARLPAADREVLILSLVDGLKPGEIAARLAISAEAARQQKSRALKKIRDLLHSVSRTPGH